MGINLPTTLDILQKHEAFAKLDQSILEDIGSTAEEIQIGIGEKVVEEGDTSTDLFLLISGEAKAVRAGSAQDNLDLNRIHAGDCIGELSFLDDAPRAASVVAETDCTLIKIRTAALEQLPNSHTVIGDLKGALAGVAVKRARNLSDGMVSALQEQLAAKTLQNQFGYFLVFTIALYMISTTLFYLVAENYVVDVYDPGFSWQTVLLLAAPCLIIIKVMKIPLDQLGIRREGLRSSLIQSFGICVALTVPILAIFFLLSGSAEDSKPVGATVDVLFLLQYFIHTVMQEVGSRGLLQGLFQKFLADTKGHRAVVLTSTIFASLHLTFGLDAVLITFFASLVFGYVYLHQKNLAGVILIHYWLGVLAAVLVAI